MQHIYSLVISRWLSLFLPILFLPFSSRAQAPSWQSAYPIVQTAGGSSTVNSLAADANGNIYITGYFTGTAIFGSTTLISVGQNDIFVAKWNPTSNSFIWAQQAGGPGNDYATAVAVNGTNVYVTGYFFSAAATFGATTLANPATTEDVFVVKLVDTGSTSQFSWAKRIGGTGSDLSRGIAVNGSSIYVAGSFAPVSNVTGTEFGSIRLTTAGSYDIFVAKLTDGGTDAAFVWAKRAGGLSYDFAEALSISGNTLYVTGTFTSQSIDFGTTAFTNRGSNSADVFVTKLTDSGLDASFAATQQLGGSDDDFVSTIIAHNANLYVGGGFYSTTFISGGTSLTNADSRGSTSDMFVAKMTDAGSSLTSVWAYRAGGSSGDAIGALATRGTRVYATGIFGGPSATFGTTILTHTGTDSNSGDIFVTELQDTGASASFSWAQGAGGTATDAGYSLLPLGNKLYVGGKVRPPATFGNQTVSSPTSNGVGYVAALEGIPLSTTASTTLDGVQVYPSPASGQTTLVLPPMSGIKEASLFLSDALGRKVRMSTVALSSSPSRYTIDLAGLKPGFYTVSVQAGNLQAVLPLVVR